MADNNDFDNQSTDLNNHSNWDKDLIADVGSAPIESFNSTNTSAPAVTETPKPDEAKTETPSVSENPSEIKTNEVEATEQPSLTPLESAPVSNEPSVETPSEPEEKVTEPPQVQPPSEEPVDTSNDFTPDNSPLPEPYGADNDTTEYRGQDQGTDNQSETQTDTPQSVGSDVDDDFLNSLLQMSTDDATDTASPPPTPPEPEENKNTTPPMAEAKPLVVPEITEETNEPVTDQAELIERPVESAPGEPTEAVENPNPAPAFPPSDQPINLDNQNVTPTPSVAVKKPFPWFWLAVGLIIVAGVAVYFLVINRSDTYTSSLPSANTSTSSGTPTSTIPEVTTTTISSDQQRQDDLTAIQKGLEQYYLTTKKYPLSAEASKTSDEDCSLQVLVSQYLSALPVDPTEPDRYYSYTSADGKTYELSAIFDSLPSGITGVKISTGFVVTLTPGVTFSENITSEESSTISATTEATVE